jgi:hypothetical protein
MRADKMSFRKMLLCVGALAALAGCDGGRIDPGLLVSGPSPTLDEAATARLRERQDLLVTEISRTAGLGGTVPNNPQQWREFGWAAFEVADEQCEAYLGALRRLEVPRRAEGAREFGWRRRERWAQRGMGGAQRTRCGPLPPPPGGSPMGAMRRSAESLS